MLSGLKKDRKNKKYNNMHTKDYMKFLAAVAVFGAVITGASSCGQSKKDKAASQADSLKVQDVTVTKISAQDVDQIETFTGTVEGYNTNNISPKMGARIQRVFVEVGDHVARGQRLAIMDAASLTQAKLQMQNNKQEFERSKQLYEVGGTSKSDYDARKMAYDVSLSNYQNLAENTYLISPISGVVVARNYDQGDMFNLGGQPLFTVDQIRPVKIKVNVSEELFNSIKKGMNVDVQLDVFGDEIFKGKVHLVYPSVDATSRTFPVEITIENQNERVRPGMFARVTFNYGKEHHVVVPDVSVVKQIGSGDRYVYTVVDGKVVYKKVDLGRQFGKLYEVKGGLSEGDEVIVEGQSVVTNGEKVNAKEGEPAAFTPDKFEE